MKSLAYPRQHGEIYAAGDFYAGEKFGWILQVVER